MTESSFLTLLGTSLYLALHFSTAVRAILRPHREPSSRVAWIVVIFVLPAVGIVAYLLLGETNIGRRRVARMREVLARMPEARSVPMACSPSARTVEDEQSAHLFRIGQSVNGFEPVAGNSAQLMHDSNVAIDSMVADIDAATRHVHLIFYIWLTDNNGLKMVEALKRAAARGVVCRAMADALGSRAMIGSPSWEAMQASGVKLAVALPIGNPFLRTLKGRIDLRNHRKIVVIDNEITYCGSQNCADPEFRVKAKYAPWIDLMMRFEGPIVLQNQFLFASDWMAHVDEDICELLHEPIAECKSGFPAQVIGTGPTVRHSAMPEVFETLMHAARHELIISTPYYVPDEAMQAALCSCARRGVSTKIIFPARNDSFVVAAASQSYYAELLDAGVQIFEYQGGLLHTKSLTLDGHVTLIGSANMDRRSFELNYENNILFHDRGLTIQVRGRQQEYLNDSLQVTVDMVGQWPMRRRLFNNTIAMLGPVL